MSIEAKNYKTVIKYTALASWLIFTLALSGWLFFFSFQQTTRLSVLSLNAEAEVLRYHRMLVWEGTVLFISLIGGGLVIAYYILRDVRQGKKIQAFFLTFSHELKTPLASLQLQAECLREDLGSSSAHSPLVERLVSDANRLSIQLENSLYLAEDENRQLLIEEVSLSDVINSVRGYWPDLNIMIPNNCAVNVDLRAFESILKNIIQNSVTHGQAKEVQIIASDIGDDRCRLEISDDGVGYKGVGNSLGDQFSRHYSGSGNGIGLFLCWRLIKKMKGAMNFLSLKPKFIIVLELPGKIV